MIFLKLPGCVEVMAGKTDAEVDQVRNRAAEDEELNMPEEEEEDGITWKEVEDADQDKGDDDDDDDGEQVDDVSEGKETKGKKCVPGIVYLGHIPPRIRPKHVRNMLAVYGQIGRVFLQSEGT